MRVGLTELHEHVSHSEGIFDVEAYRVDGRDPGEVVGGHVELGKDVGGLSCGDDLRDGGVLSTLRGRRKQEKSTLI